MNTSDFLLSGVDASCVAIVDGEHRYTYGELRAAVVRLAGELEAAPTAAGDRVGIVARNSFFWVAAYLATLYAGRVAVPFPIDRRHQTRRAARRNGSEPGVLHRAQRRCGASARSSRTPGHR